MLLTMARHVTVPLRVWFARCLILALAWGLIHAPFSPSAAGEGECEADCPCEAERVSDPDGPLDANAGATASEHPAGCPRGCAICGCAPLIVGLPQSSQDLAVILHYREVTNPEPRDSWLPGLPGDVFRPPRHAS